MAPRLPTLPVTRDIKQCGTNKPDDTLEISGRNGVKNALLWLPSHPRPLGPPRDVKIELSGCQFSPHIVVAAPGSTLQIKNLDPVFHSVAASGETAFDFPMPVQGYSVPVKITREGPVALRCKANPWMGGVVYAVSTAAVKLTDADGGYVLDVAPGNYTLKLWHERLGTREENVSVRAGETTYKDFALPPTLTPRPGPTGPAERPPPPDFQDGFGGSTAGLR